MRSFDIHPDITRASTMPAWAYRDEALHARLRDLAFAPSWQFLGGKEQMPPARAVRPFLLLPDCLDEPLLLSCDERGDLRCLSNVCTHRGHLVATGAGPSEVLRCRYHGRRFGLDGSFLSMPRFDGVRDFPKPCDDLHRLPLGEWRGFRFTTLGAATDLDAYLAPVEARCGHLPWGSARFDAARSRDYLVAANWMLYTDNYLEGFHIPYVHPGLSQAIDLHSYSTECVDRAVLQVAAARDGQPGFALPDGHSEAGEEIAAFYFWLWPNLMLNVYPWGCSVNVVEPVAVDRTRVRFLTWIWDASLLDQGAGSGLDRVQLEDEDVVAAAQLGMGSRFYERGRYSPTMESGVHHFHRMVAAALASAD